MNDYKSTLNLPVTCFPMRANLATREPEILYRWYKDDLYNIIRKAKKGKKYFLLHDGPPYANGSIHIGHSVNKILKDIIIKSKGMSGYDSPYLPGWDCHGLPIEHKVEQMIGKVGDKVSIVEFRDACRNYAAEQVEIQKKDFIRLGVLGDWNNSYLTMDFKTEANIIRALGEIINNGHLYKGEKPVYWCLDCCSVLAEAEVNYYEKISPSIYVMFNSLNTNAILKHFNVAKLEFPIVSLLIWTTTPWTIPSNRGIALNRNFEYQLIQIKGYNLILATELVEKVMQHVGIKKWIVLGKCKGSALEMQMFQHPFLKHIKSQVVLAEHVTLEVGTGAVHTAPSHGVDDYIIGQKYGLEIVKMINSEGVYVSGTHKLLDGVSVLKANDIIIKLLKDNGSLLYVDTFQHSYPHCWRHKTPVIFRTTPQWFISMDQKDLRSRSLKEIKSVRWIPSWGQARLEAMLLNRPDWCISRQRAWSVPMALFVHKKTEKLHPDTHLLIEKIAQLVEQNGISAWWNLDIRDIIGNDADHYIKVTDTLDVWFDSGSTSFSIIKSHPAFCNHIPDMYLEGSDQHRGWFMSSLVISMAINGKSPYRQVLTHGFIVDGDGRKMSKSLGNTISPQDITNKLGADVLRLWVASTDYSNDMTVSDEILKRTSDTYRRIRNTARFFLANLSNFNPEIDSVKPEEMVIIDRWAVGRALISQKEIIHLYNNYDFHAVVQRLMQFCSVEMGSFYLDVIKDRQYTAKYNSLARRSCQTALWHIIEALVRWIVPIMPFTADEIWNYLPGNHSKYVFTEEWYGGLFSIDDNEYLNDIYWMEILKIRSEVNKVIEQARMEKRIGSSLDATVTLYAKPKLATKLRALKDELRFVLLTSGATIADYFQADDKAQQSDILQDLKILLNKAEGQKCPRCWHYKLDDDQNSEYDDKICFRCHTNIYGNGEIRKFV